MTIYEALKAVRQRLNAANIESAALDASLLLSHITGYTKVQLITHDDEELKKEQHEQLLTLVSSREKGYPIAYILGYKEFWGLKLKVNEHTLIPRPDTEILVQKAIDCGVKGRILDLGTGSGAIILALKSEYQDKVEAYACDISDETLKVAKENALTHKLDISFVKSDWFSAFESMKFAMIVSNPPYIEADDPHLSETSLPFEPIGALTSGKDGLDDIRIICKEALNHLEREAPLLIEHGYNQGAAVAAIFSEYGYQMIETIKDYSGNDRVTLGYFL